MSKAVEQAWEHERQSGLLSFSSERMNTWPLSLAVTGAAEGGHRGLWKAGWPLADPRKASFYHDLVAAS